MVGLGEIAGEHGQADAENRQLAVADLAPGGADVIALFTLMTTTMERMGEVVWIAWRRNRCAAGSR